MKISTFANPVRKEELSQIILNNNIPETVETEYMVDLEAVIEFAKEHPDDGALAEKIHNCLRYFPVSFLTDQCFWHWMTIVAFREYVLNRWGAEEDLRKWLKQKWVRMGPDGKIRGSCGGRKKGEGKPKCLPLAKARAMGKKKRASAARRKRREDPNPERRGKAINVATKSKRKKKS